MCEKGKEEPASEGVLILELLIRREQNLWLNPSDDADMLELLRWEKTSEQLSVFMEANIWRDQLDPGWEVVKKKCKKIWNG